MADKLVVTLGELPFDTAWGNRRRFQQNPAAQRVVSQCRIHALSCCSTPQRNESSYERASSWSSRTGIELGPTGPGGLFARWTFEPGPEHRSRADSYETWTIEFVLGGGQQGTKAYLDPLLEYLRSLPNDPRDLRRWPTLWLGDANNPRRVRIALAEEAQDERKSGDAEKLISDLHAIGLRCAALLSPGPSAVEHGDFLYDETGLPK